MSRSLDGIIKLNLLDTLGVIGWLLGTRVGIVMAFIHWSPIYRSSVLFKVSRIVIYPFIVFTSESYWIPI